MQSVEAYVVHFRHRCDCFPVAVPILRVPLKCLLSSLGSCARREAVAACSVRGRNFSQFKGAVALFGLEAGFRPTESESITGSGEGRREFPDGSSPLNIGIRHHVVTIVDVVSNIFATFTLAPPQIADLLGFATW